MEGIILTPLKIINLESGDVMHAMKCGDPGYYEFGEAYFSFIKKGQIKGWKKHKMMTLNLIVPLGTVAFVLFDDREVSKTKGEFFKVELSRQNYQRLTVPPGIWMGFQGLDDTENMLLNIASIKHDPDEAVSIPINSPLIDFNWSF